jgi:hypothetical protein
MTALPRAEAEPVDARASAFVRARVIVGGGALAVIAGAYAYAPYVHDGPILCPLRAMLGLPCPSCGLTRAFCALAHLDLASALRYHALSPLLFTLTLITPLICGYEIAVRRSISRRFLFSEKLAWGIFALFLVHHVARTALWIADGTLAKTYVNSSWTYAALSWSGG